MKKIIASLLSLLLVFALSTPVFAATNYQVIPEKSTKIGTRYFRRANYSDVQFKNSKSGSWITVSSDNPYTTHTNGTNIIYVKKSGNTYKIMKYVCSTKKATPLKKLTAKNDYYSYSVSAVYGNNVYITYDLGEVSWRRDTYVYNMSKKSYKKVAKSLNIIAYKGKYAITMHDYVTDVSARKETLYQLTSSGMKKVKVLAAYAYGAVFIGNKIYYAQSNDIGMTKIRIRVMNTSGKILKTYKWISKTGEYGQVIAYNITAKKCTINRSGTNYTFTYSTGKLTKQS